MNGLTGYDPKAFSGEELPAPQQTFPPLRSVIGHVNTAGEFHLPCEIEYPETHNGLWLAPSRKMLQHLRRHPVCQIHNLASDPSGDRAAKIAGTKLRTKT